MTHSFLERVAYAISARSRKRKYLFFLQTVTPKPEESILDVGVNATEYSDTDNYLERFYPHQEQITGVSLDDVSPLRRRYPRSRFFQADGTNLPFQENEFDIVYSNAVIEHVGEKDKQLQFLRELSRVGKQGYLTTPNRLFPIEVHTRVPLLHLLLPKKYFDAFLAFIGKSWAAGNYMHLLSKKDLETLAREAGLSHFSVFQNRFFGFTMTLTLVWKK